MDQVRALPGGEESLHAIEHVCGWLDDDARYADVPVKSAAGAPTCDFSEAWLEQLIETGVIEPIERGDVRGWVRMFAVPEAKKERWRPIKFTADCNRVLGKETLMKLRMPTKTEIAKLVHAGECFIALDFSAYYDQFEYAVDVGRRFCFRSGERYFRLKTLAMGQRQACEVAMCTTLRLLDFGPVSTTAAIIDNVIFVGSREQVIADATKFVERVRAVNGQLNEDVSDIAALVQTRGEWGGVQLDFTAKTSAVADKTVDKTEYTWRCRESWTWRHFYGHLGLLFWAWQLIDLPMPDFYEVLRFVRSTSAWLTDDAASWDVPARIPPSVWPVLEQWTCLVLRNKPRLVPRTQAPEWIVATDASEWGWGYFAVHNSTAAVRVFGAPWSGAFRAKYGHLVGMSTFSEPQGVVNAACHLLDPTTPTYVRFLTDNTVTQASFARGYNGRSYHINECMRRLHSVFDARFAFEFFYLPGECNPADALSRGNRSAAHEAVGDREVSAWMQREVGATVVRKDLGVTARAALLARPS